jgi:soluble lytic murein transglycosylase
MQFKMILTLIGLASVLVAPLVSAQTTSDTVLLDMQQAFKKGDSARLASLLPQARGHLLEPWAAYWALRARLETAPADEVTAFLRQYQGTYQEDRLRNDWLLLLGQRRDWAGFAAALTSFRMNDDREVRCYGLAMDLLQGQVGQSDEVKAQWYASKEASPGCGLAAQSHFAAGHLGEADIWHKARLSTEARQFEATRQAVTIVAPDAGAALAEAWKQPERFLQKRAPSGPRLTQELAVLALTRWAESDPDSAATALEEHWSKQLSGAQRAWVWGAIGKQAAQNLSGDALRYFQKTKPNTHSDEHLAWYARAALRQNQWHDALDAINAMSPDAAAEPTWAYWRARALLQPERSEAERQEARRLLQDIASVRGFYPLLAQEELGLAISVPPAPAPLTAQEKDRAQANLGLQRAIKAIALGLRSEGVKEWNYSTNMHSPGGMNDRELLAAADLACANAVWDRCINTSERTHGVIDLAQRFPMPYRQAVIERSRAIDLDPAYVYGLIRQESRFITDVRSGPGASGLMQVMPATARLTAKKIGLSDFKPQHINDRDTNIAIGTGYLKQQLDNFEGSMPLAAAAYNAGPGRPRVWRGQTGSPAIEAAIWAETIPFAETRDYVKKVLANTTIYATLISGQSQSLKARLGMIGPRDLALTDNTKLP